MHDTLDLLYAHDCGHDHAELAADDEGLTKLVSAAKVAFDEAAAWLHSQKKYSPTMLKKPVIKKLITATNKVLQQAVSNTIKGKVPAVMKEALQKNVFYFSGMKTHTEMSEASSLLLDKDGKIKPLVKFQEDVKAINDDYNDNYLRSERNFAVESSQNAAKWQKFQDGKARYDLKYLTDNGPNVRETHRAMEGTVLPVDDPFWDEYNPPNGYNCHCFLVQIRKGEADVSDSDAAIKRGEAATTEIGKDGSNKAKIFRFNPGKEMKVMPPEHPYTSGNCDNLAAEWETLSAQQKYFLTAHAEKCKAKNIIKSMMSD